VTPHLAHASRAVPPAPPGDVSDLCQIRPSVNQKEKAVNRASPAKAQVRRGIDCVVGEGGLEPPCPKTHGPEAWIRSSSEPRGAHGAR
jgi:hypothetical protein